MSAATEGTGSSRWRRKVARNWAIIGFVLITAAVLQPVAASFLSQIPADELLAPMQGLMRGAPLPPEVRALFAGMFANIEFSLAFSAVKLALGGSILFCVHHLRAQKSWAPIVLAIFPLIGIAAFAGIGLFFCYSAVVIGRAMAVPLVVTGAMIATGLAVAALPSFWLMRQHHALRSLSQSGAERFSQ